MASDTTEGQVGAPVALIQFADFQCPFCASFSRDVLPTLRERYFEPGLVSMVFRHLPLAKHAAARSAAAAAICAGRAGKFGQMHDFLFGAQPNLSQDVYIVGAKSMGLAGTDFVPCLSASETEARIDEDLAEAAMLQISATPTFIVVIAQDNGTGKATSRIQGARRLEEFEKALDDALATARGSTR